MPKRYFSKEQIENVLYDRKGKAIPFESLADRMGVIALDTAKDAELIEDLDNFRKQRVGGVVPLSGEAEYEEVKKKLPWQPSASPSEPLLAMAPVFQPSKPPESAVVDSLPIDPFAPVINKEPSLAARAAEPAGAAALRLRMGKRPSPVKTPSTIP